MAGPQQTSDVRAAACEFAKGLAKPPRLRENHASLSHLNEQMWVAGLAVEAYGVRIGVRVDDVRALPALLDYMPYGWRFLSDTSPLVQRLFSLKAGNDSEPAVLYVDGEESCRAPDYREILPVLEVVVTSFVGTMASQHVFVHAGVVECGGQVILLPGPSFSGKTSLVAELVQAGAVYYSDEYAVLDHDGRVYPYAQPLGIRASGEVVHKLQRVEDLGGKAGEGPASIGLVVLSRYKHGTRWQPHPLTLAGGLQVLLANSLAGGREPDRVLDVLQRAVLGAIILEGPRGEAAETARDILQTLTSEDNRIP